jgi:hypothetical protein
MPKKESFLQVLVIRTSSFYISTRSTSELFTHRKSFELSDKMSLSACDNATTNKSTIYLKRLNKTILGNQKFLDATKSSEKWDDVVNLVEPMSASNHRSTNTRRNHFSWQQEPIFHSTSSKIQLRLFPSQAKAFGLSSNKTFSIFPNPTEKLFTTIRFILAN